ERGAPVYDVKVRWGTAVVAALVGLLMALLLLRETAAYHYLVLGNARRDRAQLVTDAAEKESLLAGAVNAYSQSIKIGATRLLGIDVRAATKIPLGIPEPQSFTWLAALDNRAALQVQLGQYPEAIGSYNVVIEYTDRPANVYAWRAIARQSWSTVDTGEGELTTEENQYELALADFAQAIELAPRRTDYYLWRAVAYQALDDSVHAEDDYRWALAQTEPPVIPLTLKQRERALSGLGWIRYKQRDFAVAKIFFEQATQANPEQAEAWVGLGYADYSLGLYADAAVAWERAYELAPDDPTVLISLGTLHWKLGGRADDASAKCVEYSTSADYFARSTIQPGQDAQAVAFTFRTLGQVQSLLNGCPDFTDPHPYPLTVNSYTEALRLDPENVDYYQKR
ncbi:MAG: tetratricopeptide repeat protein, partial [Anaerolineae bacterium]